MEKKLEKPLHSSARLISFFCPSPQRLWHPIYGSFARPPSNFAPTFALCPDPDNAINSWKIIAQHVALTKVAGSSFLTYYRFPPFSPILFYHILSSFISSAAHAARTHPLCARLHILLTVSPSNCWRCESYSSILLNKLFSFRETIIRPEYQYHIYLKLTHFLELAKAVANLDGAATWQFQPW